MRTFATYFSFEKVLYILINKRLAYTAGRHDAAFLDKICWRKGRLSARVENDKIRKQLHAIFPSRDSWVHLGKEKRMKAVNGAHEIAFKELFATVMKARAVAKASNTTPAWLVELNKLVEEVKETLRNPEALSIKPVGYDFIIKNKETKEYRAIVKYELRDAVIISLVSNYLTDQADIGTVKPYFTKSSYAFRSPRLQTKHNISFNYHSAIRAIENYRKVKMENGIFVAEVDLQKFYDCINHRVLKNCLNKLERFLEQNGAPIDKRALVVVDKYLASFSFNKNLLKEERPGKREFKWPRKSLADLGVNIDEDSIGVAQGGALSCFFANLLLHDLDSVFNDEDTDLFYIRYCDDFIVLHADKEKCQMYVDRALEKLKELKLVVHSPYKFNLTDYKKKVRKSEGRKEVNEFWNLSKSKNPYKWGPYRKDGVHEANVPYLAFVGYHLRYDGLIRVRKKSVRKEYLKQRELVEAVLERINTDETVIIKKTKNQIRFRAEEKLIAMSVGKINEKNLDVQLGFCWANGFKEMNNHPLKLNAQLRYLDRSRERQLLKLQKELIKVAKARYPEVSKGVNVQKLPKSVTSYFEYFNKKVKSPEVEVNTSAQNASSDMV